MEWNWKFLFIYSLLALLAPLPLIPLKKLLVALIKQLRNLLSCFFISCFIVSVIPSINTFESSNYFMILKIFRYSFKINKVNPFPALAATLPLIFLSNFFIAFEAKLLTNPGKLSPAKEIATFASAFFVKIS